MAAPEDDRRTPRNIVSSAHLVSLGAEELSEFEYGLILAQNAFSRWTVRCMAAAGAPELGPLDVLVLHSVNHRDRAKQVADICFVLNVEDTHTVTYSLRKLEKLGLVDRSRRGKETFFAASARGRAACTRSVARFSLEVATISMVRVIFRVLSTDRIRRLISRALATVRPPQPARAVKVAW